MDLSKEIWHCELYKLQQQAPTPIVVKYKRKLENKPIQYGDEYHASIDRNETEEILSKYPNGGFLIRDSQRNVGSFTLVIRFDRVNKNYVLYYNPETSQHFVGSKYFDNIIDLVQDGLIHMYIETRGAEILRKIAEAQVYEATPFYQSRFYTIQHEKLQQGQSRNYQRVDPSDLYNQTCIKSKNINRLPQTIEDYNGSCDSGIFNSLRSDEGLLDKIDPNIDQSLQMPNKTACDNPEEPPIAPPRRKSLYYSLRSKTNQRPSLILESNSTLSSTVSSQLTTGSQYEQIFDCRNTPLDDSMSVSVFDQNDIPVNNKEISQSSPCSNRKLSSRSGFFRLLDTRNIMIDNQPNSFKQLEKSHNFKQHTFVGPQWCDFCAHFMWGLVAQGVQCLDCGFQAHKKCSDKVPADCFPVMKRLKRVFGIELTSLAKMENRPIPLVFEKLIRALEERDLNVQGLYRISGNIDLIEEVKVDLDKDIESVNFKSDPRFKDIETLTGLIKLFLRQLPIPLITSELYTKMISIRKTEEEISIRHCQFRAAMSILNSVHYATLEFFIRHLNKVSKLHRYNYMTSSNLAIVFAPTLICKPNTSDTTDTSPEILIFQIQADFKWDCTIIQELIDGCESIFSYLAINES